MSLTIISTDKMLETTFFKQNLILSLKIRKEVRERFNQGSVRFLQRQAGCLPPRPPSPNNTNFWVRILESFTDRSSTPGYGLESGNCTLRIVVGLKQAGRRQSHNISVENKVSVKKACGKDPPPPPTKSCRSTVASGSEIA